ncbi:type II toxin-antitoxin system VapC family toxin [Chlorogloeopsis sp. ULAP01]|uniref:type II toxin-antitoxin system VapC family toxin n=1 Tax=Chlorogloeopsis sp. ULAP01 TaxID=3056483 RepID=UPI0025AA7814|nr:type II toxin-antitoxin system VapC family toxin [Chlorogloeopsis sp. ULAP01]MDM9379724.1 type II toxin-antitoxin system VapC family toxin [Chlorogloeopsis sp. ULAP01]
MDTNFLLRFVDRKSSLNPVTRNVRKKLRANGDKLTITPQNCIEFWNVATRPAVKNGFGLTPTYANRLLQLIERLFPLLPDTPVIYPEWRRLVVKYSVSGVQVHDARLVASMKVNSVTHILTFNTIDFTRYVAEGIMAVDPSTV